jgi:hypothetical protein
MTRARGCISSSNNQLFTAPVYRPSVQFTAQCSVYRPSVQFTAPVYRPSVHPMHAFYMPLCCSIRVSCFQALNSCCPLGSHCLCLACRKLLCDRLWCCLLGRGWQHTQIAEVPGVAGETTEVPNVRHVGRLSVTVAVEGLQGSAQVTQCWHTSGCSYCTPTVKHVHPRHYMVQRHATSRLSC